MTGIDHAGRYNNRTQLKELRSESRGREERFFRVILSPIAYTWLSESAIGTQAVTYRECPVSYRTFYAPTVLRVAVQDGSTVEP
jgi:hypothetical protein